MALNLNHKVKIKFSVEPYQTLGPDSNGNYKDVPNTDIPARLGGETTIDLSTFTIDNGQSGDYRWFYDPCYKIEWNSGA